MTNYVTLVNKTLSMQLDSISWNKKFDLIAVGAYMLDPSDSTKRIGKVFLFQFNEFNDGKCSEKGDSNGHFNEITKIDTSGVLDLKWEPHQENTLIVATSDSLELYELQTDPSLDIILADRIELTAMALYSQWIGSDKLIYSDSEGSVNVVATSPLRKTASKKVHENLTWVVQYSPTTGALFSGSDEGKFTGFLLENMEDEEKHFLKKFEVGITSILFIQDNVLAVGSYDDTLRLFTIDCFEPIMLSLKRKLEFGGAPWRTIAFPFSNDNTDVKESENFHIVSACARNGIQLGSLNINNWSYETITTCLEFEGYLAYGLDVKSISHEQLKSYVVASCYFDNHEFHAWKIDI